jgi:hypothetical protein
MSDLEISIVQQFIWPERKIPLFYLVEASCLTDFSEKLSKFRNNTAHGCTSDCHVGCPEGTYRLPGMAQCRPRLNCSQIKRLLPTKDRYLIGGGGVKRIYTANLQGNSVVIARVKRFKFNQVTILIIITWGVRSNRTDTKCGGVTTYVTLRTLISCVVWLRADSSVKYYGVTYPNEFFSLLYLKSLRWKW